MAEFKAAVTGETEAQFRQFISYLFANVSRGRVTTGVLPANDGIGLNVSQTATASGSVNVNLGAAVVQDSLLNGVSPLISNATKVLDIFTPNPMGGLPRNDVVVFDAATSSIRNIVGTPNASPTDPVVPATAVPLARLRHPASATTIVNANIDDLRVLTSLAEAAKPISGSVTFPATNAAVTASVAVTFPAGRFKTAPKIVAQPLNNFGADPLQLWPTGVTTSGFTLNGYRHLTNWGPATVNWVAVQPD